MLGPRLSELSAAAARVGSVTDRTIDALCNAYVDDYCALDPLTATAIGISAAATRGLGIVPGPVLDLARVAGQFVR